MSNSAIFLLNMLQRMSLVLADFVVKVADRLGTDRQDGLKVAADFSSCCGRSGGIDARN